MGNQPLIMARFIGEKKPGETRVLRNALIGENEPLIEDIQGMRTIAELYT